MAPQARWQRVQAFKVLTGGVKHEMAEGGSGVGIDKSLVCRPSGPTIHHDKQSSSRSIANAEASAAAAAVAAPAAAACVVLLLVTPA